MYEKSLEEEAEISTYHWTKKSDETEERDVVELSVFLARFVIKKTMETCTTLDLLVFITQQWIPAHGVHNGLPAPSTPRSLLSHWSTWLERRGRIGQSNLLNHQHVSDFIRGYHRVAKFNGYEEASAIFISINKVRRFQAMLRQ